MNHGCMDIDFYCQSNRDSFLALPQGDPHHHIITLASLLSLQTLHSFLFSRFHFHFFSLSFCYNDNTINWIITSYRHFPFSLASVLCLPIPSSSVCFIFSILHPSLVSDWKRPLTLLFQVFRFHFGVLINLIYLYTSLGS